jgi:osmoprotectant transport system substrate-binding protein
MTMTPSTLRRAAAAVLTVPILLMTAACGGGFGGGSGTVTIVGQNFTEADVMTQLYKELLDKAGFQTQVKNLGTRDVYLGPLEKGSVQVSADYLSSMTDALEKSVHGENAPSVASPSTQATLAKLKALGKKVGLTPLQPAKAEDANAYAVTKQFAAKHHLVTLSDLGKLHQPVSLAAASDCPQRMDCALGLKKVYGIDVTKVEPLGFDSPQTKSALQKGEVQLGQVATTDATLDGLGLVILTDDKNWQNAENLVPMVNSKWLKSHEKAAAALDKLSNVLTTDDLKAMIAKVDAERMQPATVAHDYLKQKGLI